VCLSTVRTTSDGGSTKSDMTSFYSSNSTYDGKVCSALSRFKTNIRHPTANPTAYPRNCDSWQCSTLNSLLLSVVKNYIFERRSCVCGACIVLFTHQAPRSLCWTSPIPRHPRGQHLSERMSETEISCMLLYLSRARTSLMNET